MQHKLWYPSNILSQPSLLWLLTYTNLFELKMSQIILKLAILEMISESFQYSIAATLIIRRLFFHYSGVWMNKKITIKWGYCHHIQQLLSFKLDSNTLRKFQIYIHRCSEVIMRNQAQNRKCINDIFCDIDQDDKYTQTDNLCTLNNNLVTFLVRNLHVLYLHIVHPNL